MAGTLLDEPGRPGGKPDPRNQKTDPTVHWKLGKSSTQKRFGKGYVIVTLQEVRLLLMYPP